MTAVFVAGVLVGGTMAYILLPARTDVRVVSGSGAVPGASDAQGSAIVRDAAEASRSSARPALVALDDALAIDSPDDRRDAVRDAIGLLDALPALDRAQLATRFAARFAAGDPDAAIEWARSARLPRVFDEVLAVLAASDPDRALELAVESGGSASLDRVARSAMDSSATTLNALADALAAAPPSPAKNASLSLLADTWAERDPEAALEWMLDRPSDESWRLLTRAVRHVQNSPVLVPQYLELTERYLDRIPPDVRPEWLTTMARAYANRSPEAALDWIERFRNFDEYATAQSEVILSIANMDGASAAALIESRALWADYRNLVTPVVSRWSRYDPDAVSAWAAGIPEPAARQDALISLGNLWVSRDPVGAQRFVAGLPTSPERDRVLDRMLRSALNRDNWTLIDNLIAFYSSNGAREQGVAEFSTRIARGYEAEARRLMDRYVTDPALWSAFEARLAR